MPMQWSLRLMSWFIAVLNGSGLLVLRLLGVRQAGHRHLHSPDEIEYLIAESREGGLFRPDEHERLRKALHLGVLQVEEIMIPRVRVVSLDIDTPFPEVVQRVSESPFTRIPVYQASLDHVVGFVHVQDVIRHSLEGADAQLRSLVRPILVVSLA
jgi:CBS domain containing-hemolysin-like protein